MVSNCCVVECTNRVGKKKGVRFFRFPLADKKKSNKWRAAVRRDNWEPAPHTRICSEHFLSRKPHIHPSHPDYVPSVFPAVYRKDVGSEQTSRLNRVDCRMKRTIVQEQVKQQSEAEQRSLEEAKKKHQALVDDEKRRKAQEEEIEKRRIEDKERERAKKEKQELEKRKHMEEMERYNLEKEKAEKSKRERELIILAKEEERKRQIAEEQEEKEKRRRLIDERNEEIEKEKLDLEESMHDLESSWLQLEEEKNLLNCQVSSEGQLFYPSSMKHAKQQTDMNATALEQVLIENQNLKQSLKSLTFDIHVIEGDNEKTCFYTGLKSWAIFVHLHMFLSPHVCSSARSLTSENEFFLVLVRLRLGLLLEDVADRFRVSIAVASRVFQTWLCVMYARLHFLIKWPSRDVIRQNLPPLFKQLYPNCICIIDCSEIFIETPVCFEARSKTYSNYKKHNTIKFLIGITPNGSISFLSKCWGGRVSDKVITQESNLFNHILPGDVILADRGFTLSDDFATHGAKLVIPSFIRGKNQLLQADVENSKQLSSVRIHVERVIGHLKKEF